MKSLIGFVSFISLMFFLQPSGMAETVETGKCVECHSAVSPGIVADWKQSTHSKSEIGCTACHQLDKNNPMAAQNCEGVKGTDTYISALVSPKKCAECHETQVKQFNESGHFRARLQYKDKKGLHKLMYEHEGQNHPKHKLIPETTGCTQCHGSLIKLDKKNRPTSDSWPNAGMGTVYPDGGVGNCATCHTRHKFSKAEARKPNACASCHLGPDHPNIEIFENSKHGHIYKTEGEKYNYDKALNEWKPGDYRAPTCAVCHMAGIGGLESTHNVSDRLKWNLWGQLSKERNSKEAMSPLTGDAKKGRANMKKVCMTCHTKSHTDSYFKSVDGAVELYNESYYKPAEKMRKELEDKGLLKKNPWDDEFQKTFYVLWHHEGRRARQGAAMGAPDWAHWHGFFELQQDLYKLKSIYKKRLKTGKIE